jgi:hypothetical protein
MGRAACGVAQRGVWVRGDRDTLRNADASEVLREVVIRDPDVVRMPFATAVHEVRAGRITNGLAVAGLLALADMGT